MLAIAILLAPFFAEKDGEPPKKAEQPKQFAQVVAQNTPAITPPLPERAPPELRAKRQGKVQSPEPPAPKSPAEMESKAWSPADIKAAMKKCESLQLDARVEYKPLPPIRNGQCGTPAPISVKRFTSTPSVKLRPAATMNCRTADALDRWLRTVVQPRAWALLDARVIRVRNLASYHCRFRNGDRGSVGRRNDSGKGGAALVKVNAKVKVRVKVSEHAYANAIDVAEFVTAKGEHIRVADHWDTGDERAQFLREIHAGACGIFGTVLGPEANAAHKNHFHLDMKPRRYKAFCQ
jgi:hypothetical protein